jgi:hypothetical protein
MENAPLQPAKGLQFQLTGMFTLDLKQFAKSFRVGGQVDSN